MPPALINQQDPAEKTAQVAKMSQTYKQSIRAVVWLGHDLVQLVPSRPPYGFEELLSRVEDADMLRSLFRRVADDTSVASIERCSS
ncbi:hypothetical protein F5Y09DRAFT_320441 [Xylaria sp. FL1042]|nr:hypothetical protein F5Y09DRAFT_320441 [Xylaria sp. FL1042]